MGYGPDDGEVVGVGVDEGKGDAVGLDVGVSVGSGDALGCAVGDVVGCGDGFVVGCDDAAGGGGLGSNTMRAAGWGAMPEPPPHPASAHTQKKTMLKQNGLLDIIPVPPKANKSYHLMQPREVSPLTDVLRIANASCASWKHSAWA